MDDRVVLDPSPLTDLLAIGAPPSLVRDLVGLYRTDVPARMDRLSVALAAGELPAAAVEAHSLKGSAGTLGLLRFMDLAAALERHAREGRLEGARELAAGVDVAYQDGLAALLEAFPGS